MVHSHSHTVHLPLGALLIACTMCDTGETSSRRRGSVPLGTLTTNGKTEQASASRLRKYVVDKQA